MRVLSCLIILVVVGCTQSSQKLARSHLFLKLNSLYDLGIESHEKTDERNLASAGSTNSCSLSSEVYLDQLIKYHENNSTIVPADSKGHPDKILHHFKSDEGVIKALGGIERFNKCNSVECVYLNAMTIQDGNSVRAKLSYLLYLRAGLVMGFTTDVAGLNTEGYSQNQMEFRLKDIELMWRAVVRIPIELWPLATLKYLFRIPYQRQIGNSAADAMSLSFYGSGRHGYIRFSDNCFDRSDSVACLAHEISHHIDFSEGKDTREGYGFSKREEWLNFSGWTIKESIDSSGRVSRQWDWPSSEPFITSYASVSPHEDFAETGGFYVQRKSDATNNLVAAKFEYFLEKPLKGIDLATYSANPELKSEFDGVLIQKLTSILEVCKTKAVEGLNFENCLMLEVDKLIQEYLFSFQMKQPDHCSEIQKILPELKTRAATLLAYEGETVARYNNVTSIQEQRASIIAPILEEFSKIPFEDYAVSSLDQENSKQWYEQMVSARLDEVMLMMGKDKELPIFVEMRNSLLVSKQWEKVLGAVQSRMYPFIVSMSKDFRVVGQEIVRACVSSSGDKDSKPILDPYDGDAQFLQASFLSCINANVIKQVDELATIWMAHLVETLGEINSVSAKGLKFLMLGRLLEFMLEGVSAEVQQVRENEFKSLQLQIENLNEEYNSLTMSLEGKDRSERYSVCMSVSAGIESRAKLLTESLKTHDLTGVYGHIKKIDCSLYDDAGLVDKYVVQCMESLSLGRLYASAVTQDFMNQRSIERRYTEMIRKEASRFLQKVTMSLSSQKLFEEKLLERANVREARRQALELYHKEVGYMYRDNSKRLVSLMRGLCSNMYSVENTAGQPRPVFKYISDLKDRDSYGLSYLVCLDEKIERALPAWGQKNIEIKQGGKMKTLEEWRYYSNRLFVQRVVQDIPMQVER